MGEFEEMMDDLAAEAAYGAYAEIEDKSDHELILEATRISSVTKYVSSEERERVQSISSFGAKRGYLTEAQRFALGLFIFENDNTI